MPRATSIPGRRWRSSGMGSATRSPRAGAGAFCLSSGIQARRTLSSLSSSMGLGRKSLNPFWRNSSRTPFMALAVRATMGTTAK